MITMSTPQMQRAGGVLSSLELDDLQKECHSIRTAVTEHELLRHQHCGLVHIVPWKQAEFPPVSSSHRPRGTSATAEIGSHRDVDDISVYPRQIHYTPGDTPTKVLHGMTTQENAVDHHGSIARMMFKVENTSIPAALVAVSAHDNDSNTYSFSIQSTSTLSIPYPTKIHEDSSMLCVNSIHAGDIDPVPVKQDS
ncbi:hypothetical protein J7T55_011480 [Diaporthe amygdali]|uniref:uncharacterized protein n=1 Tax=Phomopsis amygdali TaxID=1214568 RepID=UPI0022FE2942|nr:uncharacterized protein J7T55_011480 [Diaporthe amygdali]KAJ0123018.1 hypothetical protein J7T55_011480 [Diaporthe amygdali]